MAASASFSLTSSSVGGMQCQCGENMWPSASSISKLAYMKYSMAFVSAWRHHLKASSASADIQKKAMAESYMSIFSISEISAAIPLSWLINVGWRNRLAYSWRIRS